MDANQAAAMQQEESNTEEVVSEEEIAPEPTAEEVGLPSDEPEETIAPTVEELQEQIKGLEAKVKKGKDASSQKGQADKQAETEREAQSNVQSFFSDNLQDMIENGISDEASEMAESLNISTDQLELQVLKAEKAQAAIFAEVGGKEKYFEAIEALSPIYSDAEKAAFTEGMKDPHLAKMLARTLMNEYANLNKANGVDSGSRLSNNAVVSQSTNNQYNSRAEYNKDMAAMRKSPSSQQARLSVAIEAKLGRSDSSVLMG